MASPEPATVASSTAPTTSPETAPTAHPETTPTAGTSPQAGVSLRTPSKYLSEKSTSPTTKATTFVSPPVDWLYGTWTVTHSTLSMWRSAQNVRITYKPLPSSPASSTPDVDDLVEYEKKGTENGSVKSVEGIDKPDPSHPGAWNWRGKGWLKFVSSHWEILGWGEKPLAQGEGVERWVVTWFAPTLFTKEGVDYYSDRQQGLSAETAEQLTAALKALDAPKVVELVEKEMRAVEIKLPWSTRS